MTVTPQHKLIFRQAEKQVSTRNQPILNRITEKSTRSFMSAYLK